MKQFLIAIICVFTGCATLVPPSYPDVTEKQYNIMSSRGMINEKCYIPSTRSGAVIADLLILGVIPILIDAVASNLTYYEYVPGCDKNDETSNITYYEYIPSSDDNDELTKQKKRKVVYEIEYVDEDE